MKSFRVFFVSFLIYAVLYPGYLLAAETAGFAVEAADTSTIALGGITGPDMRLAKFTLQNTGDSPMEITRITSTCSCLRGYPQQATIPPHGTQVVTLEVNPNKVRGEFKRSAWVHTTDPKRSRLLLTVTGKVTPPFEGLPESLIFRGNALGEAWTNTLTLTATTNALGLGIPVVSDDKAMRVETTITTLPAIGTYALTIVATPLAEGLSSATVGIPVLSQNKVPDLELRVIGKVGSQFSMAPDQLLIFSTEKPLVRGFTVRTDEKTVDLNKITFTPQRKGITCDVRPNSKNPANFSVRITLTPEAVEALLEETDPSISFGYPNYAPIELPIVTLPASGTGRDVQR